VKLSLFAYIKVPKRVHKNPQDFINTFSNVAAYKVNIKNPAAFLPTMNRPRKK
jgi:hypothetical protein